MIAVGCSSDDSDDSVETTPATVTSVTSAAVTTTTTTPPKAGGSIKVGQFSTLGTFDPVNSLGGSGTVGGIELTAIYDTVLSHDDKTAWYRPAWTAESMTPSADFLAWTLSSGPASSSPTGRAMTPPP